MITRVLAPLVLVALVSLEAAAQDVRQDTTPLAPIVVTATRSPQPANTLGNSVTVLQGAELRRAGIVTVADALRSVAGAAVVQQSSWGSVTSLFLRGGQSNYVRVLVDGVPINQPGGSLDLSHVTTTNVERIELVRGPSSVVYGSDAIAGVLQIFTRQPRDSRVRGAARGGSYRSADGGAELTAASARAGISAGVSRSSTDGLYAFNSRYRNTTESGSLWLRPDGRTDLRLAARFNDAGFHFPTDGSGVPVDSNQFQTSRTTTVSLDAGRQLGSRLEVRALIGFRQSKDIYDDRPDHPGDTLFGTFHSDGVTDRRSADLRVNAGDGAGSQYTAGAVVEAQRERSWNSFSAPQRIERTNRAAYAQAVRGWSERVWVQAGVRLEDNQRFGTFVTWRAGASARVAGETRLRVNAGTAFKEPTFLENYNSAFSTGNPDLRPERSFSVEAGIEHRLPAAGVTVSAAFFSQRFRDMIQYTPASLPPDPNYFNIAGADASGLETGLDWRPADALRVRAEYTWLKTSVADSGYDGQQFAPGERLIRRPTHSGAISVDVTPPGRVAAGGRWLLVGTRDDLDFGVFPATRVTLAGYGRLDAWTDIQLLRAGTGLALTVRVDNVMDQPYQEVFGFPVPGRRVLVGGRIETRR